MSWGVSSVGRPIPVAAKLATQFAKNPCVEPEETVRQAAAALIAACLAAQDPSSAVAVTAGGYQSAIYGAGGKATGTFQNALNVKIEPLYGFVE
jgi:hypothetical protein